MRGVDRVFYPMTMTPEGGRRRNRALQAGGLRRACSGEKRWESLFEAFESDNRLALRSVSDATLLFVGRWGSVGTVLGQGAMLR